MVRCRSGGCKRTHKREARGRQGFQRCPSVLASGSPEGAPVPQSWQAGVQRAQPSSYQYFPPPFLEGAPADGPGLGSGSPEGAPFGRGLGVSPEFISVLPSHPGIPPTSSLRAQRSNPGAGKRESRGRSPLAGVWGCPPEYQYFPVTAPNPGAGPGRKGPGGWSEPLVHISTSPSQGARGMAFPLLHRGSEAIRGLSRPSWQGSGGVPQVHISIPPWHSPYPSLRAQRKRDAAASGWPAEAWPSRLAIPGQAGVQRASPFWQGSGGVPEFISVLPFPSRLPPTPSLRAQRSNPGGWQAGVQRAQPFGRGLGVSPEFISVLLLPPWHSPYLVIASAAKQSGGWQAGVQRAQPFGRGLGVSPYPANSIAAKQRRRVQTGCRPLAECLGGLSVVAVSKAPLPPRGPGGWSEPVLSAKPRIAPRLDAPFWQGSGGVPSSYQYHPPSP